MPVPRNRILPYLSGIGQTTDRKAMGKIGKIEYQTGYSCRHCRLCTPVRKHNTLTVKGRKPTLGKCPHNTYCVLLSQPACKEHFVAREEMAKMEIQEY